MRIEEMDALFGGNQGEQDLQRIASIRARLGITNGDLLEKEDVDGEGSLEKPVEKDHVSSGGVEQVEGLSTKP